MTCDENRPCTRCVRRGISHLCVDEPKKPRKKRAAGVSKRTSNDPKSTVPKKAQVSWDPSTLERIDSSIHLGGPAGDQLIMSQTGALMNSPSHAQGLFTPMMSNTIMTVNGLQEVAGDDAVDGSIFPETLFSGVSVPMANDKAGMGASLYGSFSKCPDSVTIEPRKLTGANPNEWMTPYLGASVEHDRLLLGPLLSESNDESTFNQAMLPTPPLSHKEEVPNHMTMPLESNSSMPSGDNLLLESQNDVLLLNSQPKDELPTDPVDLQFMTPAHRGTSLISQSLDLNSLFSETPESIQQSLFTINEATDAVASTLSHENGTVTTSSPTENGDEVGAAPFNLYKAIQKLHLGIVNSEELAAEQKQELLTAIQVVLSSIPIPLHLLTTKDAWTMERKVERLLHDYQSIFSTYDRRVSQNRVALFPSTAEEESTPSSDGDLLSMFASNKAPTSMLPTCVWRTTGEILLFNKQFCDMIRAEPSQRVILKNSNISDLLHPSSLVALWKEFAFLVASQEQRARVDPCLIRNFSFSSKKSTHDDQWLNSVASFMVWQTNEGVPLVVVGNFFPITV